MAIPFCAHALVERLRLRDVIPSRQARDRRRPDRGHCSDDPSCIAGIQNGGVDRMSGMSSMLCIVLYRDVPSHHEPK